MPLTATVSSPETRIASVASINALIGLIRRSSVTMRHRLSSDHREDSTVPPFHRLRKADNLAPKSNLEFIESSPIVALRAGDESSLKARRLRILCWNAPKIVDP